MTFELYAPLIRQKAAQYGVPENIALNLIKAESNFDPRARSSAGALGLAQLMPGTAKELGVDPLVPEQAVDGGLRYLSRNYKEFGDWGLALAGYNAGPGAVRRAGGIPNYPETQAYVKKVLGSGAQPAGAGAASTAAPAASGTAAAGSSAGFDPSEVVKLLGAPGSSQNLGAIAAAGLMPVTQPRLAASPDFLKQWSMQTDRQQGGDAFTQDLAKMFSMFGVQAGGAASTSPTPAAQPKPVATAAAGGGSLGIIDLGKTLQGAGLRVREHSAFGGVGKHSKGSKHYEDMALDVTDWQDPGEGEKSWKPRKAFLGQQIAQILGPSAEVFHPGNDPQGHGSHIHVGLRSGGLSPEQLQQITAARQKSLELYPLRWAG